MTLLETPRLILRRLQSDDRQALFPITGDAQVMQHWTTGHDRTLADVEKRLTRAHEHATRYGFGDWAMIEKSRGELIGFCGLQHQVLDGTNRVGIGYALNKSQWGQGLGTEAAKRVMHEAFYVLKLPEVIATVATENTESLKVLQKCGFLFDHHAIYDGMPRLIYRAVAPKELS